MDPDVYPQSKSRQLVQQIQGKTRESNQELDRNGTQSHREGWKQGYNMGANPIHKQRWNTSLETIYKNIQDIQPWEQIPAAQHQGGIGSLTAKFMLKAWDWRHKLELKQSLW